MVDPREEPRRSGSASSVALRVGLAVSRLSVPALWLAYAASGGSLRYGCIADAFAGTVVLDAVDHDRLAGVLNQDSILCGTEGIVRYSAELHPHGQDPGADNRGADTP